ncbi:minor capsid protein [Sporosarcina sp. P13]|uniref:minor capsid protein n=1 Tax=Sporosarcina sp. P13 TaxID=2048263 RepID=UPI0013046FE9|nr:minor capsid protein [Sporosarcina sp. P13]
MELDFMTKLNQRINSLSLYAHSSIGLLDVGESLSIMAMPGGSEVEYMDGMRDKDYQVQINAKSKNQMNCLNALTIIYQALENLADLPSGNGSYEFNRISTPSLPSLVAQDEQGFYVYALSISAKITIYKGVA